jgi:hypothetical protein
LRASEQEDQNADRDGIQGRLEPDTLGLQAAERETKKDGEACDRAKWSDGDGR